MIKQRPEKRIICGILNAMLDNNMGFVLSSASQYPYLFREHNDLHIFTWGEETLATLDTSYSRSEWQINEQSDMVIRCLNYDINDLVNQLDEEIE